MPVDLNSSISWEEASGDMGTMLDDLQPNILKGHVRDYLTILFLEFNDAGDTKALLRELAALMKSAKAHLLEVRAFKATKGEKKGTPYVGVGLGWSGYAKLGIAETRRPKDTHFKDGMHASKLNDPKRADWEQPFGEDLDGVILVGDGTPEGHDAALAKVQAALAAHPGVTVKGTQDGVGRHNANDDGIEHFGYVDGRSQPLFLTEDIREERLGSDGTSVWSPDFPLKQVILPDPAAADAATAHGSYFVYRKLEQDVQAFKKAEEELACALGLKGADKERAGALIVGRFEDGTPVTVQKGEGAHSPVPNDFDYDSDDEGGKCPFFGHIRKLNPRGSGGFGASLEQERSHIMARRGQTYGDRQDDPNDGEIENKPTGGVGLLFMAFNSDLGEQFEFTQTRWANSEVFPEAPAGRPNPGVDLIIGQTIPENARPDIEAPTVWGLDEKDSLPKFKVVDAVPQTVTMKGGGYFFMPSLSFLRNPV